MPWTTSELPFAESPSPLAGQASYAGAQDANGRAATQTLRLLEIYAQRGPVSDWDVHKLTGWERTTVNARRVPLCKRGIVVAVDKVPNVDTGIANTRWALKGNR